MCLHWLTVQLWEGGGGEHMIIKQSCLTLVPFKLAINIFPPNRLVQTAFYTPQSQLHLHSCNNELVNSGFIGEKDGRLESIPMAWEGRRLAELDSLQPEELLWTSIYLVVNGILTQSIRLGCLACTARSEPVTEARSRGGQTQLLKMDIYTFAERDIAAMAK